MSHDHTPQPFAKKVGHDPVFKNGLSFFLFLIFLILDGVVIKVSKLDNLPSDDGK